jgi:hypothetical protein
MSRTGAGYELVPTLSVKAISGGGWRKATGPVVVTQRGTVVGTFIPLGSKISEGPDGARLAAGMLLRVALELAEMRVAVAQATGATPRAIRQLVTVRAYWRRALAEALDDGLPVPLGRQQLEAITGADALPETTGDER